MRRRPAAGATAALVAVGPRRRRRRGGDRRVGPASRLTLRDAVEGATASLLARPGRALLTALGTVLGVGALVATLGLAQTAGNQILDRIDLTAATRVVVEPAGGGVGGQARTSTLPWNAEERLAGLRGVRASGTVSEVPLGGARTRSVPVNDPQGRSEMDIPLVALSPGAFAAIGADVRTGRTFDAGHDARADPVAVLGPGAAAQLGITRVGQQPAIFVGDRLLVVIGILEDVEREARLLNAVLVPNGWARAAMALEVPEAVHVDTEPGATALIAEQAVIALDPADPSRLRAQAPPDPASLRADLATEVDALFLLLGGVSLLVGAIGIANVTLVGVMERVGEIGLSRALGATRRHVAAEFLVESGLLGFAGGVLGASGGVLVVVGVSLQRGWTPVLDPVVPLAAPLAGVVIGLLAGLYPAVRAARLEPVEALRSGT